MLELDGRDELLTNGFAAFDGLHSNDTTNGHVHVGDADRLEVLSSHPLRRSSVSCTVKDVGEIQTTLSEDVPGCPGQDVSEVQTTLLDNVPDCPGAIEASTDTTDNLDTTNHHDIDDILHIVCPSPTLEHVICHKLPLVGFPR
jgi:hypothetical protein